MIQNVAIEGLSEIMQRGQVTSYQVLLTSSTNIMDPRVIWSVTDINGQETDKATITSDGELTVKKNGQIKILAKTIDGSGIVGEKVVTISGQTLASLSQDKPTVTSSVGDNHPGSFAVDGDETTRWIADSGEKNPWIYVDLGTQAKIYLIVLNWEDARPPRYVVEV